MNFIDSWRAWCLKGLHDFLLQFPGSVIDFDCSHFYRSKNFWHILSGLNVPGLIFCSVNDWKPWSKWFRWSLEHSLDFNAGPLWTEGGGSFNGFLWSLKGSHGTVKGCYWWLERFKKLWPARIDLWRGLWSYKAFGWLWSPKQFTQWSLKSYQRTVVLLTSRVTSLVVDVESLWVKNLSSWWSLTFQRVHGSSAAWGIIYHLSVLPRVYVFLNLGCTE